MGPRPTHLSLKPDEADAASGYEDFQPPQVRAWRDLPSPRAGEVPPALSPLDALAFQLRPLHEEFKRKEQNGRRISRLPPTMVASEVRSRPDYFRSMSNESKMSAVAEGQEDRDFSPVEHWGKAATQLPEKDRPVSHYPMFDRTSVATRDSRDIPGVPTPFYDAQEDQNPHTPSASEAPEYFGIPRATSPDPVDPKLNVQAPSPHAPPSLTNSIDTVSSHPRTRTNDSQRSHRSQQSLASERERGLAPPQSPRIPRSPRSFQSIRSVPPDSDAEDGPAAGGSHLAGVSSRKFSGSSNTSRPQSPFSPWMHPIHRSPSMTSEYSMNGSQQLQRPAPGVSNFSNFSRPMSSSGSRPSFDSRTSFDNRPSLDRQTSDLPRRAPSGASSSTEASFRPAVSREGSGDDVLATPMSHMHIETPGLTSRQEYFPSDGATPDANSSSSYIYAKYALPRGRPVDRGSTAFRDSWIQTQSEWDKQHGTLPGHERNQSDSPIFESVPRGSPAQSEIARGGRTLASTPSEARSHSADPRGFVKPAHQISSMHRSSPSVKTDSTDRTLKAVPLHKKSPSADLTPDEHLDIGIAAHDKGETNKSTYHLRLAALAGLPTGMLLYALACRHGWGMRPNQEEGVKWLKKAMETSALDVATAEERLNGGNKKLDPTERKKKKAQYALAIYELGNSSMHGWGCSKDKALAVRCYEVAGAWGDADALAEAAFCYTKGLGVKKDPKKGASLYRKAAEHGVSMAGNSWIYKSKYMDNDCSETLEKDRKRPDTAISKDSGISGDTKSREEKPSKSKDEKSSKSKDEKQGRSRSRTSLISGKEFHVGTEVLAGVRSPGQDGLLNLGRKAEPGSDAEQEQIHKEGTDYIKDHIADDGTGRAGDTFDSGVSQKATDGQSGPGDTFDSGVSRTATDDQSGPGDTMDSEANKNLGSEGHLEREESGQKGFKKEGGKKMENESAIPTAGGQRLGQEHWGESKIVPENPKPQEDGQPDDETARNTAKNARGAGSGDGEGKQSLVDKIKDKLPIGNKNKE
ncbi:uncharacterized protein MYCFIDRAFT_216477 [Pseudocercospora fijiensis CIRAD86]|uniref:Uncharacterized protein n=1 Tax=Pseudocercospora fijiensis (strain CIRAD86) TaxID=383855 RepID=M3AR03_PSEFD|nr:uncharacterized protein MYCFIDRAFT_216477 [Pseudocercospora fijiensis CIRAD86]EME79528.1 hypothetical protein MYCFIDRAFT_216477 [Pseudocercospora fijiensis CIRAD86]